MLHYYPTFESPWYLLLMLLIPLLWIFSFRSLTALGPVRRLLSIGLRTVVILGFILALAEIRMVRTHDRLTVIYLLDQSLSIPQRQRGAMIEYVNAAIKTHRQNEDRAGAIVFGRDAAIEVPPFDETIPVTGSIETPLDNEFTDLARAMRLAQASFPEDAAKRIVVVSDGNENLGNAVEQARALASGGVGIDVVPIRHAHRGEVIVERVAVPSNIRKGQPFDLKVVITNTTPAGDRSGTVKGRLDVEKWLGDQSSLVSSSEVELPPGKRVYSIRQELDGAGFFTYRAVFHPDRPEDDTMLQNNRASTFTHVRGKGQVLLIEDHENTGEFARLAEALRKQNVEVTIQGSDQTFANLAALQQFDTILLANVARERFTDEQIRMLVQNTQTMGAGLVMLGGPNSFGAGGWTNTELEEAMPVEFQIKSAKVVPRGALALVMHASEMAQGNFWQKKIAEEALKALGPRDYCGVIHFDNQAGCKWLWAPGMRPVGGSREAMLAFMGRMTPGDMPDFDPGMKVAVQGFNALPDAAVKHMIVISDGDPSPPSGAVVAALVKLRVTVSTVAVGTHGPAGSRVLDNLAQATGGKYYKVSNPKALPKIFQREARRVAQPLIYEDKMGMRPVVKYPHEMITGIGGAMPPFHGFVMTSVKQNPLVEVALLSPKPGLEKNRTLLASWTYGLGKAVAFTSDAGSRWTREWTNWENYDKLFGQIIVWSMRPTGDEGKFTVATDIVDGEVRVVITALDKEDEFLNFLDMSGTAVGPDLAPVGIEMEQTAPGRYVGTFPGRDAGSYFVMVSPGAGKAPIRTGVNVPYSDEFRGRETNDALLNQLAQFVPKGVDEKGRLIESPLGLDDLEPMLAVNSFRHDMPQATSSRDIWFLVVLAACCLFFFDVFVRRVQVGFGWAWVWFRRIRDELLGREPQTAQVEVMARLKSSKAEVEGRFEQLRATTRFEAPTEMSLDASLPEELDGSQPPSKQTPADTTETGDAEESYTERLLRAKKKAWEKRKDE